MKEREGKNRKTAPSKKKIILYTRSKKKSQSVFFYHSVENVIRISLLVSFFFIYIYIIA